MTSSSYDYRESAILGDDGFRYVEVRASKGKTLDSHIIGERILATAALAPADEAFGMNFILTGTDHSVELPWRGLIPVRLVIDGMTRFDGNGRNWLTDLHANSLGEPTHLTTPLWMVTIRLVKMPS